MDWCLNSGGICNGDAIAWKDPGDHFEMCEICYSHLCESSEVTI
ncbi:hypothetical protein [Methanospirillum sp.]|nr:hypothetical protein [Methanospirillum sp.]